MSLSSLYKFVLKLKGRGHFLSPKEVEFLKELLKEFSEEEIKEKLQKCFKELIPPTEREKSSVLRCSKLFKKTEKVYLTKAEKPSALKDILQKLPFDKRERLKRELKEFFGNRKPTREELEGVLRILLRKYL